MDKNKFKHLSEKAKQNENNYQKKYRDAHKKEHALYMKDYLKTYYGNLQDKRKQILDL